jgi:hypothetical protein
MDAALNEAIFLFLEGGWGGFGEDCNRWVLDAADLVVGCIAGLRCSPCT